MHIYDGNLQFYMIYIQNAAEVFPNCMLISGFKNDTFNQAKLDEILIDIRSS